MTTSADATTIELPTSLVADVDQIASQLGSSRSEVLQVAIDRLAESQRRWRELQDIAAEGARRLGLRSEDDIEDFLDSLDEE